ncbi:MAG: ATP synthase F0 subunit A [Candidatus Moranbacteria bacterium RIFCSPHIGHO2_12_FULL_54_9]|nr:MAG: ATP synthase F0 subunit A [Candidatus Moranbacteria bacterium RIFCSPHIGHO2_01_FULL_54_31]OGI25935.1 MAG: ATP synthase F0 subunit A [Candidatus Moranbacteria bacterium RIFCSPHIGHO2_12_FULL_54_9]
MEISIAAEKLFSIGSFPVTNAFLIGFLVSVSLMLVSVFVSRRLTLVPRGVQNVLELIFEGLLGFIDSVLEDKQQSRKFFPLITTIFLFVLLSNWVGLLPGAGTVGLAHMQEGHATIVPFLRSTSADLNFTIALSLIAVFVIQFSGIAALGIIKYGQKFFVSPFHKPYGLGTIMGLLELVSEFAKLLSFSFRLFGNVFAGEILLVVMLHLVPYFIPLPFLFLEVFVGFIQAAVFAMLTLVFLKMAMTEAAH